MNRTASFAITAGCYFGALIAFLLGTGSVMDSWVITIGITLGTIGLFICFILGGSKIEGVVIRHAETGLDFVPFHLQPTGISTISIPVPAHYTPRMWQLVIRDADGKLHKVNFESPAIYEQYPVGSLYPNE